MSEPQFTVNQILDRYEAECLDDLAPRTRKDYKRHLPVLRREFGERIANELKPRDFTFFVNAKTGRQQKNKQLAILSSALTHAVSYWFWADRNVLRDVKRHPSKARDRLVEDWEFEAVRKLCPDSVKCAMDLALITGQRQGDILSFKWSDIKDGAIHLQQSKTGKRMAIELSLDLKKVLGRCAQLGGREYIIVNKDGERYTSDGFRALWQRAMRKAMRGFWMSSRSKRYFTEPVLTSRWTFHDIRALAATKCPDLQTASHLLGHANPSMTAKVYRRGIERVKPLQIVPVAIHRASETTKDYARGMGEASMGPGA